MPTFDHDGNAVAAHNFAYADNRLVGQLTTVALEDALEGWGIDPRIAWRGILQHTVEDVWANGAAALLPEAFQTDISNWHEEFGNMLPSSARWRGVGRAVGRALGPGTYHVMRPRDNRPRAQTHSNAQFSQIVTVTDPDAMPTSHASLNMVLAGQAKDSILEMLKPAQTRDILGSLGILWDILTGLGIKEGGIVAARAIGTASLASVRTYNSLRNDAHDRERVAEFLSQMPA